MGMSSFTAALAALEFGIADGVDLPHRRLIRQQAQPLGGHIGAAYQSVYLLALTELGAAGGVAILQARRAQNGPCEGAGLQPALRQTLETYLVTEGGACLLRQILPAVATAEEVTSSSRFRPVCSMASITWRLP